MDQCNIHFVSFSLRTSKQSLKVSLRLPIKLTYPVTQPRGEQEEFRLPHRLHRLRSQPFEIFRDTLVHFLR